MRTKVLLLITAPLVAGIFFSCRSVRDFDRTGAETKPRKESETYKDELSENYDEVQKFLIQEQLKEVDIPKTVVYVEKPVYYPVGATAESDKPTLKGTAAAKQSTKEA